MNDGAGKEIKTIKSYIKYENMWLRGFPSLYISPMLD